MIVRLNFDLFYVIIEILNCDNNDITEIDYDDLYKWLECNNHTVNFDGIVGYAFAETEVIEWLQNNIFKNSKINILGKYQINEKNDFNVKYTWNF